MAESETNIAEIIRLLPQPLQNRFNSLGGYVRAVLEEDQQNNGRAHRLNDEGISFIQLAVFIYSLNWFLREGTRAAQASIRSLEDFGLSGFSIGSTNFTKNDENTLLGSVLAEGLIESLGDSPLIAHIKSAKSMTALILDLQGDLSHV